MNPSTPSKPPASAWWRWAIVAGYMAAIFLASSGPAVPLPPGRDWDKALHASAFAVLSALVIWAATRGRPHTASGRVLVGAWLLCTAYGATDEWHQLSVAGRQADILDLLADSLGALAAAGAIRAWGIIARGSE